MERIFHRYEKWEEVEYNFYGSSTKSKMEEYVSKVFDVLANKNNCEKYMNKVIDNWKNSCEHNLTNSALNRVAWLGQSTCCIAHKVPADATMKIWSMLSEMEKETANNVAKKIIEDWDLNNEK